LKPYYQDDMTTLYLGDCREILPKLEGLETVITDPVWPNSLPVYNIKNPTRLFNQMCKAIPQGTERLVVQLGCDSDPRFLEGIPSSWPFLRVCWLEYVKPSYKGRILYTGDVAYAFGLPPAYIPGRQLISGMCRSSLTEKEFIRGTGQKVHRPKDHPGNHLPHPSPRRLQHVEFLVKQFSDNLVCDPFMGSGTAGVAAKKLGRRFIGIEIKEEYLELAIKRIRRQPLAVQDKMIMESK